MRVVNLLKVDTITYSPLDGTVFAKRRINLIQPLPMIKHPQNTNGSVSHWADESKPPVPCEHPKDTQNIDEYSRIIVGNLGPILRGA